MASYISATFEKTYLPVSSRVRVIVRNLDQGNVPPVPSVSYFPTQPNSLRNFEVLEYINDVVGERWNRVATVTDLTTLTPRPLNLFRSASSNFIAAGVTPGDILAVNVTEPASWTSTEYPTSIPFYFSISSVNSPTTLTVDLPFPAFRSAINWSIASRSIGGTDGVTRREGNPSPGAIFLDSRFNAYFEDAVTAENFVVAVKAGMDSLANTDSITTLISENYTASP